jgi:multisubunit Na+/H+ antiporter MnhG subunit
MRALRREPAPTRDLTIGEVSPFPRRTDRWESLGREVRSLLGQFTLRPHGDQLLAPTARFWIFCARVLILIMATAEAVSWGYVGSLFGSGIMSFFTALAAAVSLFFVIWLVDATFVSMDTSRAYYHKLLATDDQLSSEMEQRKFYAGLAIRGVIVVVSLWITAPFLAQLVFRRDVVDTIASRNRSAIASTRAALVKKYDDQIAPLDSTLNASQSAGIAEASGRGPSGRYGRGAAVIAIEERNSDLRRRIAAATSERDSVLFAYDHSAWSDLGSRFGVPFLDDGLRSRSEVLGIMMDNPDYSGARVALAVFLSFLFLGLLILKLFQPRSVSIYYSEQLQSLYTDYSQGKFDEHLDPHDRARVGAPMTPQRFEEWCLRSYRQVRDEDARRHHTDEMIQTHERKMRTWVEDLRTQEDLLDERRKRYEQISADVIDIESRIQALNLSADTERRELARSNKTLEAIAQHIATGQIDDVRSVERGFAAQAKVQAQIDELEESLRIREGQIGELELRIPIRREEAQSLREDIADLDRVVRDLYSRMAKERTSYNDWLGSQPTLRSRKPNA